MANYGIVVANSYGDILIDGDYKNYFLHQKLTGSWNAVRTTLRGSSEVMSWVDLSFSNPLLTQEAPIICAVGVGKYVAAGVIGNAGNWTGVRLMTGLDSGDGSVSYIVHAYALSDVAGFYDHSDYGIQVFNSSGEIVFDSRKYPMRIKHTNSVPTAIYDSPPEISIGDNVVPDMQLFGSVNSNYSSGGTRATDFAYRMMAKRSGSTTYIQSRYSAYSSYTASYEGEVPFAFAEDPLYEIYPGRQIASRGGKIPYTLVKDTPF